jgi:hypothetical protein
MSTVISQHCVRRAPSNGVGLKGGAAVFRGRTVFLGTTLAMVALTPVVRADPLPAPPPASSPAAPPADTITLKSGKIVTGVVTAEDPGTSVSIRTADGIVHTYSWDVVQGVTIAAGHAPPPTQSPGAGGGATTMTTTQGSVDSTGAHVSVSADCQQSPDSPKCHREANVQAGTGGASIHVANEDASGRQSADISNKGAHAEMERDCSANPSDERCVQKGSLNLGPGGLNASFKQETVTAVKEPPSGAVSIAIDLGGGTIFGGGGGSSISLLDADIKIKMLAGSRFPGSDGGSWNGVALEPSAAVLLLFESSPSPDGTTQSQTLIGYQLGGSLGYQFMSFGKMEPATMKQSGFGLQLAGYVGVTGLSIPSANGGSSQTVTNASYGPEIGLSFPTYNAGTASYSAFAITGFLLPSGDGSMFLSGSLGWIF